MSDSYQAFYDAARSKIQGGSVQDAIENAMRDCNIGHYVMMAANSIEQAASAYESPAAVYKPKVYIDGDQWCALYGENLQDGVAGFGASPALAMSDFEKKWYAPLKSATPSTIKEEPTGGHDCLYATDEIYCRKCCGIEEAKSFLRKEEQTDIGEKS